jgi:hypothetical protein
LFCILVTFLYISPIILVGMGMGNGEWEWGMGNGITLSGGWMEEWGSRWLGVGMGETTV